MKFDRIDKKILTILQDNCSISNQELAARVALSPTPCLRRVKQLEEKGVIDKKVALLKPEIIGLSLTVILAVGLGSHAPKTMQVFEKTINSFPEVIACYLIAGQTADYLLEVVVSNMEHYHTFLLKKLTRIDGVNSVQSSFVLNKVIKKTALPLDYM